jgi:phosphate transport system permease protein
MIRRRLTNWIMLSAMGLVTVAASIPFFCISWYVIEHGASSLTWAFFTQLPKGPGDLGGGMGNAMLGSLAMLGLAGLIGIPWGLASGIYLSEYGRGRTAQFLRFSIDLLASTPSIVVGIFVYGVVCVHFGFSAYAGALALAIIMLPIVARSAEEILKLVPTHYREAGLALGVPRWKVILRVLVPGSIGGLMTGVMLAVARVAGETAPLLFTALGNQFFSHSLAQPTASLPVQIYNFAKSGYVDLERQAWAGALVLVAFVFVLNVLTRWMLSANKGQT